MRKPTLREHSAKFPVSQTPISELCPKTFLLAGRIFFTPYKNEFLDQITDSELLEFMRVQFDEVCRGDLDYLAETCLERFSRAVRSGYVTRAQKQARDEYRLGTADNEYQQFDEEERWAYELYRMKTLE